MKELDKDRAILGIWDGHDAGAALVIQGKIISAINEERLSRRKLEIGYPEQSIEAVCNAAGLAKSEIGQVVFSTTDFAKTLTRMLPQLGEEYYLLRRRKKTPSRIAGGKKLLKYALTELPPFPGTKAISTFLIRQKLRRQRIEAACMAVDHHAAHAASAFCTSGISDGLILTLDGVGDGASGSIWRVDDGNMVPFRRFGAAHSLGIFFEHVTNLLHLRELEDEGKVMALANYAYPTPDQENPLLALFDVHNATINAHYHGAALYRHLEKIFFRYSPEQFAYLAQRTLEVKVVELTRQALSITNKRNLAYAGGVAANVKVNMLLRELPEIESLHIFPHMGDGGLAAGAALWMSYQNGARAFAAIDSMAFGPSYTAEQISSALPRHLCLIKSAHATMEEIMQALLAEHALIYFSGRMELGPRALCQRSILALPWIPGMRERLNLGLKKRAWYQPFCPVLLRSVAKSHLLGFGNGEAKFMTSAYSTTEEFSSRYPAAVSIDGSCRPQVVDDDEVTPLAALLRELQHRTGHGVLVNTSLNIHGEPLACTPADAVRALSECQVQSAFIDPFLVQRIPSP